ncbi:Anthranilate synthase, amidotransferase component @ Para-aminobenzoate synthase, amidotransferase component [hydrothermal vent metagenome]|uniref:Anthranilate synthase, amidotransferase component @ Para-aminobenzoate synthase, amidotransferase component n=1 Tax=hydrothermal vent metagenome TaxID=652676 RepID=A0A3B0S8T4_9ZZZZ
MSDCILDPIDLQNVTDAPQILVIDNYDSFTFNLVHYLQELGAETIVLRNDAKSVDEFLGYALDGVLLSPGPCTPNEAGVCLQLIEELPEDLPLLGVCLGHQAIGQVFGGNVVRAKTIMHGKTSTISHDGTGVFAEIPDNFVATRYHSLSVAQEGFPDTLLANAWTPDGEIMGLRHPERPIHGVQFHPESIASQYGHELLANFLKLCKS